jgi:hypothetical protein
LAADRPYALITYDGLPISAGGAHRIRGKDRAATWTAMLRFLHQFTTYREPDDVRLLLAEGPRVDRRFFANAQRAATYAFGRSERRLAILGEVEEHENWWALGSADVDDALALMQSLEPFPDHWLDAPLALAVNATFRLRDAESAEPFPAQDPELYGNREAAWMLPLGRSAIYLRLTTRSTCALLLALPFAEVAPALVAYVRRIDQSLPFRLSRRHWSRWQLNARGTRYYKRRISVLG